MDENTMTDDVPLLGALFDTEPSAASAPAASAVVAEEAVTPESSDAPTAFILPPAKVEEAPVTVPAEAEAADATVEPLPPLPPSVADEDAALTAVKSSPRFGTGGVGLPMPTTGPAAAPAPTAAPTVTPGAPLSPPSPPVTPETLAEASPEAAPAPAWQKPLTSDETKALFGDSILTAGSPKVRLSPVDAKKAAYRIEPAGAVGAPQRDAELAQLQSSGAVPTTVRKIDNYSSRVRMNLELVRVATEDRNAMAVLGVTDSAKFSEDAVVNLPWDRLDVTDYVRFAWAAYSGAAFGSEAVVLDADGNPVVKLEGHDAPLKRPNGQLYFPRKVQLGGKDAPELFDTQMVKRAYEARIPVLLYGPPGTGKTALSEACLPGLVTISGTADTETADFVGSYVQNPDGTFLWVDGPLVHAMENGVPLFIDEIALIDSRVLALVYSVMDGRNEIVITANPLRGTVTAKDGFYVIGACNPNVPGAVMSDALLSRFSLQMEVTTDYDMLKTLGVDRDIITVAKNLAKTVANGGGVMKAPQTRELLAYMRIKKTLGQELALGNLVAGALPVDRERYVSALRTKFDTEIVALST